MPLRFELSSIVWGEKYTKLFLEFLIPNYLSGKNIPQAAERFCLFSCILTTPEDAEKIAAHPHYKKLREFIGGEILPVVTKELLNSKNKWGVKGYCQSLAIKKAIANQSVILLLNPDSLISDGGLFKCCSLIEEGKKAVVIGELARIETESILPDLTPYFDPNASTLTLPNRPLTELGIKYLHKESRRQFWNSEPFCKWTSIVYWPAGEKSLLAKFFHVHPLAIDLRNVRKKLPPVLMPDDGGLIEFLGIRRKDIYLVTDSNELVCVELSSKEMDMSGYHFIPQKEKKAALLKFSFKYAISNHIGNFLDFSLRFQGTEEIDWNQEEKTVSLHLRPLRPALSLIRCFNLIWDASINGLRTFAKKLGAGYIKRKIYLYRSQR